MERIKLNLIPSGVAPIVHLSQYDDGRKFGIDLFEGESVYVLDGTETLTVNSRKPDGHVVTLTVTNTGTSFLDVDTVEQLTAVHGVSYAKLQIVRGSVTIATLPFLIDVSRDPLENGDPSESFVQNLRTQIAEGVAEEVATQYDSSNVIFDNEPTENHGIGYTVTSEGIKTAIDNAFDYDNTASGSLVHITDGADNVPVKSLVSEIVAVETGNGQPKSPTNPYTISGYDNGVVTRCGKNLVNLSNESFTANANTTKILGDIYLKAGTYTWSYTLSTNLTVTRNRPLYVLNGSLVYAPADVTTSGRHSWTFALLEDATISLRWWVVDNNIAFNLTDFQIEIGDTASEFEAYNGNTYTFAFGQTVYGGHFDNKGNLVVTHGVLDLGSVNWQYNPSLNVFLYNLSDMPLNTALLCEQYEYTNVSRAEEIGNNQIWNRGYALSPHNILIKDTRYTDYTAFKTAVSGVKLVYELTTPITLTITSQDIPTLLGENNIFSNCGDVEVEYYTNKSNDILEFIDSEIGKKNGTNIPIEEDSQDSIKDYIDNEVSTITTSLSNKANKTEDTTITVASGYTLISSCCGKTDRLVHLNFNVEKTGGFATGWQVIGTTEFKPNTLAYCPLWNVTNGVGNGEVRIDTDGTINFYIVTAGELRLNANIGYITN